MVPRVSRSDVEAVIARVLSPGHFFAGPGIDLAFEHLPAEELYWELFRGRLLDASATRVRRTLESWNVYLIESGNRSPEPILSIRRDSASPHLYVIRGIECYLWEAYPAGDHVIESRKVRKWVRELVGILDPSQYDDIDRLRDELAACLFRGVIGSSRLPLTSIEAPLPAFSLGQLAYTPSPDKEDRHFPMRSVREMVSGLGKIAGGKLSSALGEPADSSRLCSANFESAKVLETILRATPASELGSVARCLADVWHHPDQARTRFTQLFLRMFDEISLSPWTDFAEKSVALLSYLDDENVLTPAEHADCLTALLRRLGRHLTAFDLIEFHHRGANYPDVLLIDLVLKACLDQVDRHPELYLGNSASTPVKSKEPDRAKRLRRRGIRQGWLLRRHYEGHRVPPLPTSPGENLRVLPPPFVHLDPEEISDPGKRSRRLFADDPIAARLTDLGGALLRQCVADLEHDSELQELGTALFLDRPLGTFKHPVEPDRTVLLSYLAFSRSLACRRLREMHDLGLLDARTLAASEQRLQHLPVPGIPLERSPARQRPGVASLQDAFHVAGDFVLVATTRRSVSDFLEQYDLSPFATRCRLDFLQKGQRVLIVGGGAIANQQVNEISIVDAEGRRRLDFDFDPEPGYAFRGLVEHPASGLRLIRIDGCKVSGDAG